MKTAAPTDEPVLGPDFAQRVIERVRAARRRRRAYWAITCAAVCALAAVVILSVRPRTISRSILLAGRNHRHSESIITPMELGGPPAYGLPSFGQPLAFFFPGATAVADFQSAQAAYWHAYDPWWNPNA